MAGMYCGTGGASTRELGRVKGLCHAAQGLSGAG